MMPTWRSISGENDARDEIYDLWIVILGDEWYSFLLNDKKYEQWGCPNLIYQLRSNVWLSHSSFLALHKGGRLSCVLSRSLQLLHWTCQLLFGFEMSIFLCERVFAWEDDWKDFQRRMKRHHFLWLKFCWKLQGRIFVLARENLGTFN